MQPQDPPYSPFARGGALLFVSGQIPRDHETGQIVGGDIRSQAEQVLRNLERVLHSAGSELSKVVSVTVYLADENDWGAYNEVHARFFSPPYPSRTVVGARLRGILVEVSAIAAG